MSEGAMEEKRKRQVSKLKLEDNVIAIICTIPSGEPALKLARSLVEMELAACVNIVDPIASIYRWEGMVEEAQEALLIIKSRSDLWERLAKEITARHPYTIPEIIALPIVKGNKDYLKWVIEQTVLP